MASFACVNCRRSASAPRAVCGHCNGYRTIVPTSGARPTRDVRDTAVRASELESADVRRADTGIPEWDHVLGGGAAVPSSILLAGAPGVGKTTHAAYAAGELARALRRDALILSAEMTAEMVVSAARRVGADLERILIRRTDDLELALSEVRARRPACVVWDSIQTFAIGGESGSDLVTCEVVRQAIEMGARVGAVTFLVSQLNAAGRPEGRRRSQHAPDVVMHLEHGAIRVTKNRFGPAPVEAAFAPLVDDDDSDDPCALN